MKRSLRRVLVSTLLIACVYLVTMYLMGKQVETEVDRIASELISSDHVRVTRFEYERGLTSGQLHYDLMLEAVEGAPLHGSLQVDHGPWLGLGRGFGFAKAEHDIAVPDSLRQMLPQYPGQQPLLSVSAAVTLGGSLDAAVDVVNYDGRLIDEVNNEVISLRVSGLSAQVKLDADLQRFEATVQLQTFRLAGSDVNGPIQFVLQDLSGRADWQASRPWVWTGSNEFSVAQLDFLSAAGSVLTSELRTGSNTTLSDDMIQFSNYLDVGRMSVNGVDISGAGVMISAGNIAADAYADLAKYSYNALAADTEDAIDAGFVSALEQRLLAGNPWLALDRLSVSLVSEDDVLVTGRMSVGELNDDNAIVDALQMQAGIQVTTLALRQFARLYVQGMVDSGISDAEIAQQADLVFEETKELLQAQGYVEVSADQISLDAALEDGWLLINGARVMELAPWFADTAGAMTDPGTPGLPGSGPGLMVSDISALDQQADPLYGQLNLAAGFSPDPVELELVAGGGSVINTTDINNDYCVGHINADQADVVINYAAGNGPLYVSLDAAEDTTLVILDPAGQLHCNDDGPGLGLNAGLVFDSPQSGSYRVWAGTYEANVVDALLLVSETAMRN